MNVSDDEFDNLKQMIVGFFVEHSSIEKAFGHFDS